MPFNFDTKAGTLSQLKGKLVSAKIVPLVAFSLADWRSDHEACLDRVASGLPGGPWIVRSSCSREDNATRSNAGSFLTLKNITESNLEESIEKVIESYVDDIKTDQVLIQFMLKNVLRSGVAFSHDPNTCSPYRVVNWSEGDDTSIVTGGAGGRTWLQAAESKIPPPKNLSGVVELLDELLELFNDEPLDFEFAFTTSEALDETTESKNNELVLWLLQVRRLILARSPQSKFMQSARLQRIQEKVARGMLPHPFLIGESTVYGVMPDWNPAEIIGLRPKPLALSLYRELITDSTWAYQRNNYGYRHLRSFPLMPHFFGLPYIDVRLSFNSFIPVDLEEGLAGKLVDYYVNRLLAQPALHDKVEFEIVFSCYTFDLSERLERLEGVGFSNSECKAISNSLRNLTNRILHPKEGLWREDAAKLERLEIRRAELLASNADPLERIYWLVEDAKRYGTLPFAGLARAGFMAIQILKSLVSIGIFSEGDYDAFVASVSTVSGQLARDLAELDKTMFLSRYGHLRPGTYDILSPRYDEAPDLYFDWEQNRQSPESIKPFYASKRQTRELEKLLQDHGLHSDPKGFFDFLRAGIESRELAKFHFTRNLSDALALIKQCGKSWGFSTEDLSYCDIATFKELHVAAANPKESLARSIEQGKSRFQDTLAISLPALISKPEDVWAFELPKSTPNFITQKQVTAPVVSFEEREMLAGALVCIPNADPGFDWLFSYPIAGLITAWGGANSHMAIRAGELGLPAVLGVGEILFERWSSAKRLHLDCAGRRVEVLS
ncbi:MAG: PEP-utilizing enzyme [Gammaproteobacteria bacterium]|nr:PEP-utilizing enzyme [Gammaproteobacteria bacterium]